MNCRKDLRALDFSLPLCIVSKYHKVASEDSVVRGWRDMWVYAGLDERGLGKEVKAVLPDKSGRKEGGGVVRCKACCLIG